MSEMAVVSASKVRLQHRADSGSSGAAVALAVANDPNRFLSTVQIGITLVGILAGAFGGATLSVYVADWLQDVAVVGQYADAVAFLIVVSLITYLSLVVGELVPKRLALQNAEMIAALVARPMLTISSIAAPLVWLLGTSTNLILRLLRVRDTNESTITEEEVAILLQQGAQAGVFEASEHAMVMNVFGLGDRIAAEIMTPRVKVASIDINASNSEIREIVNTSGHQTFPVVDGNLDNVLGIVSLADIWQSLVDDNLPLSGAMQPPVVVPESMSLFTLLEQLQQTHSELALVVNEYGAVEGLITLRDVIDEILDSGNQILVPGALNQPSVQLADGSWSIDGLLPLHNVEDVVGIQSLDEWSADQYETLGGFVMSELGRIPVVGDTITWNEWTFEVIDMDGYRIDRVVVRALQPTSGDE